MSCLLLSFAVLVAACVSAMANRIKRHQSGVGSDGGGCCGDGAVNPMMCKGHTHLKIGLDGKLIGKGGKLLFADRQKSVAESGMPKMDQAKPLFLNAFIGNQNSSKMDNSDISANKQRIAQKQQVAGTVAAQLKAGVDNRTDGLGKVPSAIQH